MFARKVCIYIISDSCCILDGITTGQWMEERGGRMSRRGRNWVRGGLIYFASAGDDPRFLEYSCSESQLGMHIPSRMCRLSQVVGHDAQKSRRASTSFRAPGNFLNNIHPDMHQCKHLHCLDPVTARCNLPSPWMTPARSTYRDIIAGQLRHD